jgi:hypothetical protein
MLDPMLGYDDDALQAMFRSVLAELEELRNGGAIIHVTEYVDQGNEEEAAGTIGSLVATFAGRLIELNDVGRDPFSVYWVVFENKFSFLLNRTYGVAGNWEGDGVDECRSLRIGTGDICWVLRTASDYERWDRGNSLR